VAAIPRAIGMNFIGLLLVGLEGFNEAVCTRR
jgi:hypothetical protein